MTDMVGRRLKQYEITGRLGTGGMATVYRAQQLNIKREVAIKVIKADLAASPDFVKRFEREAQTIASLSHPHILKLFDYGEEEDLVYLVMEIMAGGSLDKLIYQGRMDFSTVKRIAGQIASALDYAHREGIIHRDLKPQNVLLDNQRNAYLTDFGIAKLVNSATSLTQQGTTMGTPSYMAPEQWRGESIDARADIYAFGVMLYEMLGTRLPFNGDTPMSMMYMHLHDKPAPLLSLRPDIPAGVEPVLDKALAKDRDARFQSAGELADALHGALDGQAPIPAVPQEQTETFIGQPVAHAETYVAPPVASAVKATGPAQAQPTPTTPARSRLPLIVGGIAVVALVALVVAVFSNRGQATGTTIPTGTSAVAIAATSTVSSTITLTATEFVAQATATTAPPAVATRATATEVMPTVESTSLPTLPTLDIAPTAVSMAGAAQLPLRPNLPSTGGIRFAYGGDLLWIDPAKDGSVKQLLHNTSFIYHQKWSADGSELIYLDEKGAYSLNLDDAAPHPLAIPPDQVQPGIDFTLEFALSTDGKRIAFQSDSGILILDAQTGKVNQSLSVKPYLYSGIVWSPDGKQFAFVTQADLLKIQVADADGSNLRDLAPKGIDGAIHPTWSPDGTQIAFSYRSDANKPTLGLMNADGSNPHPLVESPDPVIDHIAWSPNGKHIAFIPRDYTGNANLYVVDTQSAAIHKILPAPTDHVPPGWSPDSKQLVYLSDDLTHKLLVVNAGEATAHPLSLSMLAQSDILSPAEPFWLP